MRKQSAYCGRLDIETEYSIRKKGAQQHERRSFIFENR